MLSSYINNNNYLTLHNITKIAQCRCSCSNYCVSSIHTYPLLQQPPHGVYAQATPSDLQRQLQLAVYFYRWRVTYLGRSTSRRPAEAHDFTRGRQVRVYCCLISYRWHLPRALSCSCRRIDVMCIPDFGAFAKYINHLVDFVLLQSLRCQVRVSVFRA